VQNSNETIHHGHITKRGSVEMRSFYVQCVLEMVRSKKITEHYRIITKYRAMKQNKGSGASIITTARKMSTIVYRILKTREPFDPSKMVLVKKYTNMQSAAFSAA
jgi:hypothetical protein